LEALLSEHYSVGFERDDEGWWLGRCHCGWEGGMYPDAEDAADALMDHAYACGVADAADRAGAK
jgi:hypothetical protein